MGLASEFKEFGDERHVVDMAGSASSSGRFSARLSRRWSAM